MLKGGLVRMVLSGVYSFLPLGWRIMAKIARIVREEMDAIGAQELHLPVLTPEEIWKETGRLEGFGPDMFKLVDRRNRQLCLAPTHEELIAELARNHIRSYRDLPQIWYQIQPKFRDEARPRSGVMRGRQFIMKDSYSLDTDPEALKKSYDLHDACYRRIFTRCGLKFHVVEASSGLMGGAGSQEFMVAAEAGEDRMVLCLGCGYTANMEVAVSEPVETEERSADRREVHTPDMRTIEQVSAFLKLPERSLIKSLVMIGPAGPVLALVRGDYELNEDKLSRLLGGTVRSAGPEEVKEWTGVEAGFVGPLGSAEISLVADDLLQGGGPFVVGAGKPDYHLDGIRPSVDFAVESYHDIRLVKGGDKCRSCGAELQETQAIELGHIFQLGTKYSEALGAGYLDSEGKNRPIVMGSYGIGLERIMASVIETHQDDHGMVWPVSIAPYEVIVVPLNMDAAECREAGETIYQGLKARGIEVLIDDRDERPGAKFKDSELLGIPLRVTVGEKALKEGKVELYIRSSGQVKPVSVEEAVEAAAAELEGMKQARTD
jgi:prolyl-tRNA synthetase